MTYTMGSLFAGGGGFELGFERAGFKTIWQVERDEYCRKVLAKNFPHADRSVIDVREAGGHNLARVDVICGGFPCQDISNAGLRAGIGGERSGLWKEYARIIRELRPKFVVVENVAALLGRGMGVVLGDLAEIGYDAEWEIISAADMGAPHLRERVWIVAYPISQRHSESSAVIFTGTYEKWNRAACEQSWRTTSGAVIAGCETLANAESERCGEAREFRYVQPPERLASRCEEMAYSISIGQPGSRQSIKPMHPETNSEWQASNAFDVRSGNNWELEPSVGRVVDGVPVELVANELRLLGNAVVPQIPEMIARRIKKALEAA